LSIETVTGDTIEEGFNIYRRVKCMISFRFFPISAGKPVKYKSKVSKAETSDSKREVEKICEMKGETDYR
jgi:hypothetical protein